MKVVGSQFLLAHLPLKELGETGCIVRAHPQYSAVPQVEDDAFPPPQVPDPTALKAVVDSPAIEDQRSPNLDLADVLISHRSAKQRQWAEADHQSMALVHDRQVVKGRGDQTDEKTHARNDESAWSVADPSGEDQAQQR